MAKFKFSTAFVILILVVGGYFLLKSFNIFSFTPLAGQQVEGTTDPLYVYSNQINGFGSSLSSKYIMENVAGNPIAFENKGYGINYDNGQLKWTVKADRISADKVKVTLLGVDMVLWGSNAISGQQCWAYPDVAGQITTEAPGYYFGRTTGLATNTLGHTFDVYNFNTNSNTNYDQNKNADLTLSNVADFGWRKVKHLDPSEMVLPAGMQQLNSWTPTAGIKAGVIPTIEEIDGNYSSYSPIGTTLQCGDVYAFKKEFTVTVDPNTPQDNYVVLALDDNFQKTAKIKTDYLLASSSFGTFTLDTNKAISDKGNRTTDLSKLFYAHFGSCGDNVPLRYSLLSQATGFIMGGQCSYYSIASSAIYQSAYVYKDKLYTDHKYCSSGTGCPTGPDSYSIDMTCPDGSTGCEINTKGNVTFLAKYNCNLLPGVINTPCVFNQIKTVLAKSDPNYNAVVELQAYPNGYSTTIDFSKVEYAPDLQKVNGIIHAVDGKTPEEISYLNADEMTSYTLGNCNFLPRYETSKTYEAPLVQLSKSDDYVGIVVANRTWIYTKGGGGQHPYIFFYSETPEYINYKNMFTGTTCASLIDQKESETDQTVVPNDVITGDQTLSDANQQTQTGDKTAYGSFLDDVSTTVSGIQFNWLEIGIVGGLVLALIIVYYRIIKK